MARLSWHLQKNNWKKLQESWKNKVNLFLLGSAETAVLHKQDVALMSTLEIEEVVNPFITSQYLCIGWFSIV